MRVIHYSSKRVIRSSKDVTKRVDTDEVRKAFAANFARAAEALSAEHLELETDEITKTESGIDCVVDVVEKLHDHLKLQQEQFCDLGVKYAWLQSHVEVLKQQIHVASGITIRSFKVGSDLFGP